MMHHATYRQPNTLGVAPAVVALAPTAISLVSGWFGGGDKKAEQEAAAKQQADALRLQQQQMAAQQAAQTQQYIAQVGAQRQAADNQAKLVKTVITVVASLAGITVVALTAKSMFGKPKTQTAK